MQTVALWIPLAAAVAASAFDLRNREIPDAIPAALLAWAVAATIFGWHAPGWWRLIAGVALGLLLAVPLFYLGGLGGGDVKLIAALGAVFGPAGLAMVLLWTALAGGVLALVASGRGKRDLAYAPAIAAGVAAETLWPFGLWYVLVS